MPEGKHNHRLKAAGQIPRQIPGVLSAALLNVPSIPAEKRRGRDQGGRTLIQRGCGCSNPGSVQGQVGWDPKQPGVGVASLPMVGVGIR